MEAKKIEPETTKCWKDEEPFFQCCCECVHHVPDLWHCSVDPEAHEKGLCYTRKGWVCLAPEFDGVFSGWPEHSVGCEMFERKIPDEKKDLQRQYPIITDDVPHELLGHIVTTHNGERLIEEHGTEPRIVVAHRLTDGRVLSFEFEDSSHKGAS